MSVPQSNVDIAIVGMSCRFPGAASAEEYWKNLCEGVESVTFFSDQELLAAGIDPALVADPNYVKAAPMLRDVETFDASFFGYSPKDAALMDPQQRLFLEVCWEAFENAGYNPFEYPGKVGVLSTGGGVVSSYLLAKLHHAELPGQTASISHINNDKDFLSTRVAFKLNLRGPSFTIQSACSSSLVAVHQACQNLRFDECDMMLVGGAVVRVPQVAGYLAEKRNLHSLDGHCRPFDAVGQGTIFGSGVGAVLVKPLKQAIADRDHIFAVIKSTAANNDGSAKSSYTAPSLGQQSQAVVDALKAAGVSADSVGYLECHSTGTIVGDPLEIEALSMAFRTGTQRRQYCAIGSVKANIGHPEQAAGIAGVIKTALVLHHKRIPPSINYDTPNPGIDFAASPFFVNTKLRDFPSGDTPRRAGLNSLGIGGTNVFAVFEEAPPVATKSPASGFLPNIVTLSAKSADALVARVEQLLNWLNDNPDAPIGDVCYTTNLSRSQFAFRFAARARSSDDLKAQLSTWLRTTREDRSNLQQAASAPIAFMFSGQGSQHAGMAAQLYRSHSVFRDALNRCHALAQPHLETSLLDVIFAEDGDGALVNRTDYTQPALFALEYALAELLKSWRVVPDAVIGHSLGEFAAACTAGILSLEDAMRLVTARGALMHGLPGGGGMVSIMAPESDVRPLVDRIDPEIAIAAMNGPLNTVVSGDRAALKKLTEELDRQGLTHRELRISNGFHSPRTEPILDDLERVAAEIAHNAPQLPFISNVTGDVMTAAPDKSYWRRHTRESVRFGEGMLALAHLGYRTFIEVGPHPVLLPLGQACLQAMGERGTWIATLNRQEPDAEALGGMLVALYLAGHNIDWSAVHAGSSWRRIPLPTYPFQRKRHWIDGNAGEARATQNEAAEQRHPFVGGCIKSTPDETIYEVRYGVRHAAFLSDHRVAGSVVLPTTVELEAATAVGRMHFRTSRISFDDAMHHQAMPFGDGEERIVRVVVSPLKSDKASFRFESASSREPGRWQTHMTGTLRASEPPPRPTTLLQHVRARCGRKLSAADLYGRLAGLGLEYGPSFRGIQDVHAGRLEALTRVCVPDGLTTTPYVMHPAFLDACLHAYPLVLDDAGSAPVSGGGGRSAYLPVSLERYRCYQDGTDQAWVHVALRRVEKDGTQVVDIKIYDVSERLVAELEGLAVRRLTLDKVRSLRTETDGLFYRAAWRPRDRTAAPSDDRRLAASWIVFADASKGVGAALASRLEAVGHRCHLVYRGDSFVQQGPRTWSVNERQPDDFPRLLQQIAASEMLACAGVVYLWGLDAPSSTGLTLAGLKSGCEMMCRGALAILHALAETRSTAAAGRRLWFVTTNTQNTQTVQGPNPHLDPVQAPLWGLGRSIAIEYPGLWGGLIDLQLTDRAPDPDLLAAELLYPDGENQIAISATGQRYVPRFVEQSLAELPPQLPAVRGDATYLITGGLGMLGRSVARWLVGKGAKHLVLTGRNAKAETAQTILAADELGGAAIYVLAADVSRDEDVRHLIQTINRDLPPLKGVVQSAGILDDGILAQLDWGRFERLFEPRVYGSWLLHEYTKSLDLDFFILKSSLLSLLGSAGQGNYTASSAFLDSLAAYRRATGLPATAINWCAWSGGGLATVSGARGEAMWSGLGVKFVTPELAMQAFDSLMHRDVGQLAVADADWPTYASQVGDPPFLSELVNGSVASDAFRMTPIAASPAASSAETNEARQRLLDRLQQHVMAKLGFTEAIDPDQRLNDLGVDSLMSVALSNSLEKEFGLPVSVAELIKGPTINQLLDGVFRELIGTIPPQNDHPPGPQFLGKPILVEQPKPDLNGNANSIAVESESEAGRNGFALAAIRPPEQPRVPASNGKFSASQHHGSIEARPAGTGVQNPAWLRDMLQRRIMAELGFAEPINPDQPLNEVGLDSLRSVALSNRLEKELGVPVPVAKLLNGPTINQLADYLTTELAGAGKPRPAGMLPEIAPPPVATAVAARPAVVHTLSGPETGPREVSRLPAADNEIFPVRERGGVAAAAGQPAWKTTTRVAAETTLESGRSAPMRPTGNGFDADGRSSTARVPGERTAASSGRWLSAPRPNPDAKARLFCFPYAGGGLVSFRTWPQLLDDTIELVAVEPPGRGTRIGEPAVEDLDAFVAGLMPEMIEWLDRPSAFFGHCLGGLTMFATLCALPDDCARFVNYAFACGIRPPQLLRRRGRFEDNLAYDMMLHRGFDSRIPPYAQEDDIFADIIRHFDTPAADRMLEIPKLRKLLLPTIRAEFGMAFNYRYQPIEPFPFPIASFIGASDPWVSVEDSAGWANLTRGGFVNHVRKGSHFLMADDREYILETINREFGKFPIQ